MKAVLQNDAAPGHKDFPYFLRYIFLQYIASLRLDWNFRMLIQHINIHY